MGMAPLSHEERLLKNGPEVHATQRKKERNRSLREVGIKEHTLRKLLKTKESLKKVAGAVTPGSRTINKAVFNTRIIES